MGSRKSPDGGKIGYRRPPKSTRFRAGQSGNPKGRPKGAISAAKLAHSALERTIPVTERGAQHRMTMREIAYRRMAEKAIAGDIKALAFLLSLEEQHRPAEADQGDATQMAGEDAEIIQAFLDRQLGKGNKE